MVKHPVTVLYHLQIFICRCRLAVVAPKNTPVSVLLLLPTSLSSLSTAFSCARFSPQSSQTSVKGSHFLSFCQFLLNITSPLFICDIKSTVHPRRVRLQTHKMALVQTRRGGKRTELYLIDSGSALYRGRLIALLRKCKGLSKSLVNINLISFGSSRVHFIYVEPIHSKIRDHFRCRAGLDQTQETISTSFQHYNRLWTGSITLITHTHTNTRFDRSCVATKYQG